MDMFRVFSNNTEQIKLLQQCAGSNLTRILLEGPPEEPLYMLKPEVLPMLEWINNKILFELPNIKNQKDIHWIGVRIRICTNMFLNKYEENGILSKEICIKYHERLTDHVSQIIGNIYTEDLPF